MTEFTRLEHLEAIAFWANETLERRKHHSAVEPNNGESEEEFFERRAHLWAEVKSADSMLRANLIALKCNHGPVDLKRAATSV